MAGNVRCRVTGEYGDSDDSIKKYRAIHSSQANETNVKWRFIGI